MAKYVEFPLDGGGTILIETPDEPDKPKSGFVRSGIEGPTQEWADKAQRSFNHSITGVRQSAEELVNQLSALSPDEMEVNFSLKATGELGGNLVIAKLGGEVNYSVTLKWRKEDKKDEKKDDGKKEG
jgi:hypothetical protein